MSQSMSSPSPREIAPVATVTQDAINVTLLGQAIRHRGHWAASLNPLDNSSHHEPLELAKYNLTQQKLESLASSLVGGPIAEDVETAGEVIQGLYRVYCSKIGYDYEHIQRPEEQKWLQDAAESGKFRPPRAAIDEVALFERLTQVENFERVFHRTFPGKTRFSIEGLDMMVPMLDEMIGICVQRRLRKMIIGMTHRGRLNVLAHILHKPYAEIFLEFKDMSDSHFYAQLNNASYTGDVKYHFGAEYTAGQSPTFSGLQICLAPNPSHLEHVNPIVAGMARAASTYTDQSGSPRFDPHLILPIVIHGDAAFCGQGIAAETLNLAQLDGYTTGGAIHIVANNQLGFTTNSHESRSTCYATDLVKGFNIPVVHVNADDPLACIEAARLAVAYRNKFGKDFFIDLIGYRRYGHNEGDEPRFTQPTLYHKIDAHPSVRKQLSDRLAATGYLDDTQPDDLLQQQVNALQNTLGSLHPDGKSPPKIKTVVPGAASKIHTAVPVNILRELHQTLIQTPLGFTVHPRLQRVRQRNVNALNTLDEATIEWSTAEQLALASLMFEGIASRLTGQDAVRGTFSHRHAVLFDVNTGLPYTPLQHLPQGKASFEVYNSPLSEAAVMGFEYGYSLDKPEQLVIWEAQYGDFINTAQAIIDEFIVSGFAKWNQTSSLVLLLPHGYEGQGPDHASARLERFLQMGAEVNMRIVNPTTAAQYFHLLRQQGLLLSTNPLPLIVMTPKSLLRHPLSLSTLRDLAEGRWQPVFDDVTAAQTPTEIKRLLLCSGKVYVDLVSSQLRTMTPSVAIVRIEQLYPFPSDPLSELLLRYSKLKEVVWVQEEPWNMGAWSAVKPQLQDVLTQGKFNIDLHYVGRPCRASPAEGSRAWHQMNQEEIVMQALTGNMD